MPDQPDRLVFWCHRRGQHVIEDQSNELNGAEDASYHEKAVRTEVLAIVVGEGRRLEQQRASTCRSRRWA
jgi:hypothetical protein